MTDFDNYTRADYLVDLKSETINHTESREHFQAFYDELGRDPLQISQEFKSKTPFLKPAGKILDLGCLNGSSTIHFAREGFEVVGVDLSQTLIEIARENVSREPEEVRNRIVLIQSWIEDLELAERFDTVLLLEVLEHVIDPETVVRAARRHLKSDGTLHISMPCKKEGTNSHLRGMDYSQLSTLVQRCEMRIIAGSGEDETTSLVAMLP